jgi:hypothetical protein
MPIELATTFLSEFGRLPGKMAHDLAWLHFGASSEELKLRTTVECDYNRYLTLTRYILGRSIE